MELVLQDHLVNMPLLQQECNDNVLIHKEFHIPSELQ